MAARGMSVDVTAIAFKVVAILEAYQLHMERLASDWPTLHRKILRLLSQPSGLR